MLCNTENQNLIYSEQLFGIRLEVKVIRNWAINCSDLMAVEPQTSTSLHRHAENRPLERKGKQHFLQVPSLNKSGRLDAR